jgi:transposase
VNWARFAPRCGLSRHQLSLNPEQLEILRQLVAAQPDATLSELRERLYEKTEVLIGVATVNRMVRRKLNLNLKKKVSTPRKKVLMKSNWPDLSTGNS